MLRQNPPESAENQRVAPVYRVGDLVVDTGRMTVCRDGRELPLPRLSFDLLVALIEASPRVVSPDELMDRVWPGLVVGPETVSQRVKLLRDSLGDDPKTPRYVAGVRGRGYRLLPAVARQGVMDEPAAAGAGPSASATAAGLRRPWILPVAALAVAAGAGIWMLADRGRDAPPGGTAITSQSLPARSVAVLAFEDRSGTAGSGILAEGIPETVLHQLARLPGVTVIARGSSFAFQDRPDDLRVIGRKLNVRYLLEGSVQTDGQRLRITSSLVDAETGASVWSMQFDRATQDVFAMQDEIAIEVARAMQLTIDAGADAVASLRRGATGSYEAYLAFLRGRALLASFRVADLPEAIESLSAAIRQDPEFASAYVLLARARVALAEYEASSGSSETFPRAIAQSLQLLDEALALDPQNGQAYIERGHLKAYFDVAAADADLRRGIELAPSDPRGYEGRAAVLFQSAARRSEALGMIEKARRLDPLEPRLDVLKATYLSYGPGDRKQAIAILEAVLDRHPLYVPALVRLGNMRWHYDGQHAEAALLLEQATKLDPGNETAWRQLAAAYLDMGDPSAARLAFRQIGDEPPHGWLSLNLYDRQWKRAGEAAYALIEAGPTHPIDERRIALAIRMHARATGDYRRAIDTLVRWAAVSWEDGTPLLEGQLDQGIGVAALADMLAASGDGARARVLAAELIADIELRSGRYGRGVVWLDDARAMAWVILDRPEEAIAAMRRQAAAGVIRHEWRFMLEDEPLFEGLRQRADFQALVSGARSNARHERERLERMRADGLIPSRGATTQDPAGR